MTLDFGDMTVKHYLVLKPSELLIFFFNSANARFQTLLSLAPAKMYPPLIANDVILISSGKPSFTTIQLLPLFADIYTPLNNVPAKILSPLFANALTSVKYFLPLFL